jgi:glycerol-3-phosphate dehydrogenase (NAD(P)+)
VFTSRSVHERITSREIDAPIMTGVYQMVHEGKPPLAVVQDLMTRPPKDER